MKREPPCVWELAARSWFMWYQRLRFGSCVNQTLPCCTPLRAKSTVEWLPGVDKAVLAHNH